MNSTRARRYRSDARLWAHMADALRESMPTDQAERLARVLVATVRREQQPGSRTWGPGEELPDTPPRRLFDLHGAVWEHQDTGHGCYRMAAADRAKHADTSRDYEGVRIWPHLLDTEGPVTAIRLRGGADD